jgi:outer membrane receptor protein involved in Fe transport
LNSVLRPCRCTLRLPALSLLLSTLCVVGTALTPAAAYAQAALATDPRAGQPGTVTGSLSRMDSNKPAANVTVTIRETGQTTITDEKGRYSFPSVLPGTYTLIAMGEGYGRTRITDVVVRPGHELSLSREAIVSRSSNQEPVELEDYIVSAKKNDGVTELDIYEVRDRRITPFSTANLDLMRARDDVLPFNTFSERDIEVSGATDLADFLRTRIPQNFAQQLSPQETVQAFGAPPSTGTPQATTLLRGIDLRRWGQKETVILVNGLRLPLRYSGDALDSPTSSNFAGDYANIPLASIERIELLSSAASAIYGANATGGVINIITKQNYAGGQVAVNYSDYQKASAPSRSVNLNYGRPLGRGFQLTVSASYSEAAAMTTEDVADVTILRWRRLLQEREPARLTRFAVLGATPNISGYGLWTPGVTGRTSVPDGYRGSATGDITPFLTRKELVNFDLPEGSSTFRISKKAPLGLDTRATTYSVGVSKAFRDDWRFSTEVQSMRSEGWMASPSYLGGIFVPANVPTNPFGIGVSVSFDDPRLSVPGLGARYVRRSDRLDLSLRGKIAAWQTVLAFNLTRDIEENSKGSYAAPVGGFRNALLAGTYNPFVDMRAVSPGAPGFYDEANIQHRDSGSKARGALVTLRASGPIWTLPAGDILLTTGLEHNYANLHHTYVINTVTNNRTGARYDMQPGDFGYSFGSGWNSTIDSPGTIYNFDNQSAYAEVSVPLLNQAQRVPLINKLEVHGSGRLSRFKRKSYRAYTEPRVPIYEKSPVTDNYSAGIRYDVTPNIAFRASRSIGYVYPQLGTFSNDTVQFPFPVNDRRRNDEFVMLTPDMFSIGGNPDIKPETTTSTNFGVILTPQWMKGLRVSIDYLSNIRDDAIELLFPQTYLDYETIDPRMGARISRGTPEPGAPNGVGPITFVDARYINLFQITNRAADFRIEYTREDVQNGRLIIALEGTKNISFKRQTSAGVPAIELLNDPTLSDGVRWGGNLQLRWEGRRWTFGWAARYLDSLLVNPVDFVAQGAQSTDSAIDHDAYANWRLPDPMDSARFSWLLSDMSLSFGVKNVFDRTPRFWAAMADRGVVPYDSVMGRSFWIQIRKKL